jgi:hypothetical protein
MLKALGSLCMVCFEALGQIDDTFAVDSFSVKMANILDQSWIIKTQIVSQFNKKGRLPLQ